MWWRGRCGFDERFVAARRDGSVWELDAESGGSVTILWAAPWRHPRFGCRTTVLPADNGTKRRFMRQAPGPTQLAVYYLPSEPGSNETRRGWGGWELIRGHRLFVVEPYARAETPRYSSGEPAPFIFVRLLALPLVAACSIPPLLWLALRSRRLFVRRRRRRLGLCLRCGYDLTGNTSGVCSECGTAIEAAGRVNP